MFLDLVQKGRSADAEAELEKLLGGLHVKFALAELSKLERGDDIDAVKISELLFGHYFRGKMLIYWNLSRYVSFELIYLTLFHSGFHWIKPICFTTAFWHKCCVLFLFGCL